MEKYATYTDFNSEGFMPIMSAVVQAVPLFWPLTLFALWIGLNGASYFTVAKLTGKKRFLHTLTATSFVMFIASLVLAAQNTAEMVFLSGYWVAFYIVMTMISFILLHYYK